MILEVMVLVIIALGLLLHYNQKPPPNFPPGPTGLPLLGFVSFLRLPLYKAFEDLSNKYGNICGFFVLNFPVVILGDAKTLKEGFGHDEMIARPKHKLFQAYLGCEDGIQRGILTSSGKGWQAQRRFAFKNLAAFGLRKGKREGLIMNEVVELINGLKKVLNRPVDLREPLTTALFNLFWYTISGEKYSHDDPKVFGLINKLLEAVSPKLIIMLSCMPRVAEAFPKLSGLESFLAASRQLNELVKESAEAHKKTLDINNPRDIIDAYLIEIESTTDPDSTFYKEGEKQLLAVLLDLYFVGSAATSISINWIILYLMMYPNVQEKLHIEIDSVVGTDRNPSLLDKPRMPYLEAVVTEALRFSTATPYGIPHVTSATVEFNGYTIPKYTVILGNMRSIHYDKEIWGDPENFRPERFIDDEGEYKGSDGDGVYAFSVGKRMCPGESIARDEMFLLLAGLLQQFRFEVDVNNPPTLEPKPHPVISQTQPYNVIIRQRNNSIAST